VTEQRAQQHRLQEEQQLTDSIFSALPDVLYTFDTAGYLIRWNDQLEAETGYSTDEMSEMHVTDSVRTTRSSVSRVVSRQSSKTARR